MKSKELAGALLASSRNPASKRTSQSNPFEISPAASPHTRSADRSDDNTDNAGHGHKHESEDEHDALAGVGGYSGPSLGSDEYSKETR